MQKCTKYADLCKKNAMMQTHAEKCWKMRAAQFSGGDKKGGQQWKKGKLFGNHTGKMCKTRGNAGNAIMRECAFKKCGKMRPA